MYPVHERAARAGMQKCLVLMKAHLPCVILFLHCHHPSFTFVFIFLLSFLILPHPPGQRLKRAL
eukprot:9502156-Pyramimonas_sp.AAC.1